MQVEIDFKTQKINNLWDFQKQQVLDELKYNIVKYSHNCGEQFSLYDIGRSLYGYLNYMMKNNDLKFMFGKYKDLYVDMVLREDEEYCEWFSNNVIGKDFNTLKILDYIHKRLLGQDYFFLSFEEAWKLLETLLTPNMLETIQKRKPEIKKDYNYFHKNEDPFDFEIPYFEKKPYRKSYKRTNNYTDYGKSYDDDECSEFCYYGDCLLDYGDLC